MMLLRNVALELNNVEAETCGIQSSLAKPQSQAAQRAEWRYWISDRECDETHLVGLWVVSYKDSDNKFLKVYVQVLFPPKKFIPENMFLSIQ